MPELNALIPLSAKGPDIGNSLAQGIQTGNALTGRNRSGVFGTPIPYERDDGTMGVGVFTREGGFQDMSDQMPGQYAPGVTFQNLGSGVQPFSSKTGRPVAPPTPVTGSPPTGYVPPQSQPDQSAGVSSEGGYMPGTSPAEVAEQSAAGKTRGENVSLFESMTAKLPGLIQTVEKLEGLSDKATYTLGGQALDYGRKQLGMDPGEGAVARSEYIAIVDNQVLPLLRDTFGAQFTVEEGKSLRATLGDPDKSPQEKQAVLRAFISQKAQDIEALGAQINQGAVPAGGSAPAPTRAVTTDAPPPPGNINTQELQATAKVRETEALKAAQEDLQAGLITEEQAIELLGRLGLTEERLQQMGIGR